MTRSGPQIRKEARFVVHVGGSYGGEERTAECSCAGLAWRKYPNHQAMQDAVLQFFTDLHARSYAPLGWSLLVIFEPTSGGNSPS